jgi:hypothetical protein
MDGWEDRHDEANMHFLHFSFKTPFNDNNLSLQQYFLIFTDITAYTGSDM